MIIISGFNTLATSKYNIIDDFDPLVDLELTITIDAIRALDEIQKRDVPDFYINIYINNEKFTSPICNNQMYVYEYWSVTSDIPDHIETVSIIIELWDYDSNGDTICDISKKPNNDENGLIINLTYNIKTGHWYGDDYSIGDGSGYGRASGCGDGSIYTDENDCELWFSIFQNDFDNDSLPYWVETNVYNTDPMIDNRGEDFDKDGCPIEWEHTWGFNPLIWDDHGKYDPDGDSLTNVEEYLTSDFGSDPFRKDVFLELDFMEESPDGIESIVPKEGEELLKNPFHRRDIVFHIDSGEVDGGDIIEFDDSVDLTEVLEIYNTYFLNNDENNWKRGVFHYGIIVYKCTPGGYGFSGDVAPYMGYIPGTNGLIISSTKIEKYVRWSLTKTKGYYYGSAIMHEMGHNFGRRWGNPFGCDVQRGKRPWMFGYWFYRNYKSIMNYRYTYKIFDYSDGSHGIRDSDDWEKIDLTYFEKP